MATELSRQSAVQIRSTASVPAVTTWNVPRTPIVFAANNTRGYHTDGKCAECPVCKGIFVVR
eukprot:5378891-Prymnesium_polylepis.1